MLKVLESVGIPKNPFQNCILWSNEILKGLVPFGIFQKTKYCYSEEHKVLQIVEKFDKCKMES